jgi:hypothetical protein
MKSKNSKKKPVVKKATKPRKKKATEPSITLMDIKDVPEVERLHVKVINPESDYTSIALGVSDERYVELNKVAKSSYFTTDKFSDAMEKASAECLHANELAIVVFLLAEIKIQSSNPLGMILASIRPGKKEE